MALSRVGTDTPERRVTLGSGRASQFWEVTTIRAVPVTFSVVAAIVAVPLALAVTSPATFTDAIAGLEDDHVNVLNEMAEPLEFVGLATSWN